MTNQTKTGLSQRGSWQANPWARCRFITLFQIAAIFVLMFGLQSSGQAQGNLADLYDWNNETQNVSPATQGEYVSIFSANSAGFYGGFATNNLADGYYHYVSPILTGNLDTTSGATYEVSFTMVDNPIDTASATVSFGDFTTNFDLPINYSSGLNGIYGIPVTIDFTAVATSATTTMSFQNQVSFEGNDSVYDLEVTEVPETSATRLFLCGGFVLLLAKRMRPLIQKRKLAVN